MYRRVFRSTDDTDFWDQAVRPAVDIPLSEITILTGGAGTSALPYQMSGY